ncbi:Plasmodium vivax Vir protein, putative [Plasmodium vivax]|nr:Plasmodium vivax Vir protein, putative [Plasmodium vivax]
MEEHSGAEYAESILKESPLYLLYNKFNRDDIEDDVMSYCNKRTEFRNNDDLYKLCKMFEKNLSKLPTIMGTEEDNKEYCRYLTFWINDNIRNIFKRHHFPENKQNRYMQAFLSVSHLVNEGLSKPHCDYYYDKGITMEIWKKWKDLYDYIRNEHTIQEAINKSKDLCDVYPTYYSYIEKIYKYYKEECCNKHDGNCPDYLGFNEWCKDGKVLNILSCADSHQDYVPPVKSPEVEAKGERVGEEGEGKEAKKGEPALSQDLRGEAPSVGSEGGQFLTEIDVRGGPLDAEVTETSNIHSGIQNNYGDSPKDNASNPVRTITYTSLGLVLPLATLYRFTPLGSWVNTKILGKNKLMDNMKKNHYELLLNDVRNGDMSLNDITYSISYNSAAK